MKSVWHYYSITTSVIYDMLERARKDEIKKIEDDHCYLHQKWDMNGEFEWFLKPCENIKMDTSNEKCNCLRNGQCSSRQCCQTNAVHICHNCGFAICADCRADNFTIRYIDHQNME